MIKISILNTNKKMSEGVIVLISLKSISRVILATYQGPGAAPDYLECLHILVLRYG